MATAINKVDNIIEFTCDNEFLPGIYQHSSQEKGYRLRAYVDKWIYPWKYTIVPININSISLPNNTIGFIQTLVFCDDILNVKTKVLIFDEECCYLMVKANGLFPRKVCANEDIATLHILSYQECHLVNN